VLVTGCSGFVGPWMIAHLESHGDETIGIDEKVDITDIAALRDAFDDAAPDAVCHLAAVASVGASWADQLPTYQVNVLGSVNLLLVAQERRPRPRVLLVSSSEVYGRVPSGDMPIREDRPFAPVSPYAATKAASEVAGLQAWLGGGLEVVRARPFNHTGPGQRPDFVIPALAKQIADAARAGARSIAAGNLQPRRDVTDVRDVVRAYRLLLESGVPGEVYNVCSGTSVSIADIATRLLGLAGLDVPVVLDPARVREVELPELRGDPTKIREATGWAPEIPLEVTLADVLDYWRRPAA
jgi:GDP-4-dehydro-6-deoxy-D-mannose reductase